MPPAMLTIERASSPIANEAGSDALRELYGVRGVADAAHPSGESTAPTMRSAA